VKRVLSRNSEVETGMEIPGEDEQQVLQFLDHLFHQEAIRAFLDGVVQRLEARLQDNPSALMAWESVPLTLYGTPFPGSIRSSWVFILKADVATGAERHPNSRQRMMSYRGSGDLQTKTGEFWRSKPLLSGSQGPLDQRWISIRENVWHQAVTSEANWAVVSFHTVPAEELIEERPDRNDPGLMHQKRYLDLA
jgi:hypothetical protein